MMYETMIRDSAETRFEPYAAILAEKSTALLTEDRHGDDARWQSAIDRLPTLNSSIIDFESDAVTFSGEMLSQEMTDAVKASLKELHPWRKGPFSIHGIDIDTEWRSNLKWDRFLPHISSLKDRLVLDIGCGNGYYAWRMVGQGARLVIGIDPTRLFIKQFEAIRHFADTNYPIHLLPLGIEALPAEMNAFDTVFSMGVLYHRRSPFDHLIELRNCLRQGGELVLETLVIDGEEGEVLVPQKRYAKMRNVWFIPSPKTLIAWLSRVGFVDARVVDIAPTTVEEQRSTDWMHFESFSDFLDPNDRCKTIEGYPGPTRVVIVANRP